VQITVTPEKRDFHFMGFQKRAYLGVDLQELDADLSGYFQTKEGSGVLVTRVESDSPAMRGGLKSGDVITEFDGKKVNSAEGLRDALADVKDGASVGITVLRHGKEQKLTLKPEQSEGDLRMLREMNVPRLQELPDLPDMPELRESLEGLREQMKNLKLEMNDLHLKEEDMRKMKEEIHKELDKFREELKQSRKSD